MAGHEVSTWQEFETRWDGSVNFLLTGECRKALKFDFPPIEQVVEEMRRDPGTGVASGAKDRTLTNDDIKAEFLALPVEQALQRPFSMSHYRLGVFDAPGRFLYGFRETVLDPWKASLRDAGFTFDRCYPIIFLGGPKYSTNYHMDFSHVLPWQIYGTKRFCGLNDPDSWAPREMRVTYGPARLEMPSTITEADSLCHVMKPGDVLWNAFLTPHWIEASDTAAMSVNISHGGLRFDGRLCKHEQELEDFRQAYPKVAPGRVTGTYEAQ